MFNGESRAWKLYGVEQEEEEEEKEEAILFRAKHARYAQLESSSAASSRFLPRSQRGRSTTLCITLCAACARGGRRGGSYHARGQDARTRDHECGIRLVVVHAGCRCGGEEDGKWGED